MSSSTQGSPPLPAQDLVCPDPADCPVATGLPPLRSTTLRRGTPLFRVYDATWGYDEFNPGYGDARFSPIDDPATAARLPSMYLAVTPVAALLETAFRDITHQADRIVYERDLLGKVLAQVRLPADVTLGDLCDPELARLGVSRAQVVASPAEHYPCTRRLARDALAASPTSLDGLCWQSRQAELLPPAGLRAELAHVGDGDLTAAEVAVLYGRDDSGARGSFPLAGVGVSALIDGPGRLFVEELAEQLDAWIEPIHGD